MRATSPPGGGLFGLLLGPALALAGRVGPDMDGGKEPLGVVRSLVLHLVPGQRSAQTRGQFLQPGLVVLAAWTGGGFGDPLGEKAHDQALGLDPASVQVDGTDDRLHGVGQDRRLLPPAGEVLAPAEQQGISHPGFQGDVGQRL
jgi:hypothetical protein